MTRFLTITLILFHCRHVFRSGEVGVTRRQFIRAVSRGLLGFCGQSVASLLDVKEPFFDVGYVAEMANAMAMASAAVAPPKYATVSMP